MSASDADGAPALTPPKPSPLGGSLGGGGLRELLLSAEGEGGASPSPTPASATTATATGSLASSQQYQHHHRHRLSSLMDSDGEIAR
jgi:hypothetical protein